MITEHAVCALPADHRDWRYVALRVKRRGATDRWVIEHTDFYWDGTGWWSSISEAKNYDETEALRIAEELKANVLDRWNSR